MASVFWRDSAIRGISSASKKREELEQQLRLDVEVARYHGATWAQIGEALGITRQSAHERFKDFADPHERSTTS